MTHAEKCPVCNGKGKVKKETCYGCLGYGWVTVQDQLPFIQPIIVPEQPYQPWTPMYPTWSDTTTYAT